MLKKLAPYLILFTISLFLAYKASLPEEGRTLSSVKWFEAEGKLSKVFYKKASKLELTILPHENGYFAREQLFTEGKPTSTSSFKTSQRFLEFAQSFKPFYVKRVIGKVDKEKKTRFGFFDDPKKQTILELHHEKTPKKTFQIGHRSFGSSQIYLFDEDQGEALLVDSRPFDDLDKAKTKMINRLVHKIALKDIEEVAIKKDTQKALWKHNQKEKRFYDAKKGDAKESGSYLTWIEKIGKLRVLSYLDASSHKELLTKTPLFSLELLSKTQAAEKITFWKIEKGAKGPLASPGKTTYFVLSSHLQRAAKVSSNRLEPLDKDLSNLLLTNE